MLCMFPVEYPDRPCHRVVQFELLKPRSVSGLTRRLDSCRSTWAPASPLCVCVCWHHASWELIMPLPAANTSVPRSVTWYGPQCWVSIFSREIYGKLVRGTLAHCVLNSLPVLRIARSKALAGLIWSSAKDRKAHGACCKFSRVGPRTRTEQPRACSLVTGSQAQMQQQHWLQSARCKRKEHGDGDVKES